MYALIFLICLVTVDSGGLFQNDEKSNQASMPPAKIKADPLCLERLRRSWKGVQDSQFRKECGEYFVFADKAKIGLSIFTSDVLRSFFPTNSQILETSLRYQIWLQFRIDEFNQNNREYVLMLQKDKKEYLTVADVSSWDGVSFFYNSHPCEASFDHGDALNFFVLRTKNKCHDWKEQSINALTYIFENIPMQNISKVLVPMLRDSIHAREYFDLKITVLNHKRIQKVMLCNQNTYYSTSSEIVIWNGVIIIQVVNDCLTIMSQMQTLDLNVDEFAKRLVLKCNHDPLEFSNAVMKYFPQIKNVINYLSPLKPLLISPVAIDCLNMRILEFNQDMSTQIIVLLRNNENFHQSAKEIQNWDNVTLISFFYSEASIINMQNAFVRVSSREMWRRTILPPVPSEMLSYCVILAKIIRSWMPHYIVAVESGNASFEIDNCYFYTEATLVKFATSAKSIKLFEEKLNYFAFAFQKKSARESLAWIFNNVYFSYESFTYLSNCDGDPGIFSTSCDWKTRVHVKQINFANYQNIYKSRMFHQNALGFEDFSYMLPQTVRLFLQRFSKSNPALADILEFESFDLVAKFIQNIVLELEPNYWKGNILPKLAAITSATFYTNNNFSCWFTSIDDLRCGTFFDYQDVSEKVRKKVHFIK